MRVFPRRLSATKTSTGECGHNSMWHGQSRGRDLWAQRGKRGRGWQLEEREKSERRTKKERIPIFLLPRCKTFVSLRANAGICLVLKKFPLRKVDRGSLYQVNCSCGFPFILVYIWNPSTLLSGESLLPIISRHMAKWMKGGERRSACAAVWELSPLGMWLILLNKE